MLVRLTGHACRYLGLHARGGNHAHINFIGISRDAAQRAQAAFERTADKYHFAFEHIPASAGEASRDSVAQLVGDHQYFQVFLPDGSRLVHVISRCAPAAASPGHLRSRRLRLRGNGAQGSEAPDAFRARGAGAAGRRAGAA